MNFILVINGNRLKKSLLIAVAIVFTCGILYSERETFTVFSANKPTAIYAVPTDQKIMALTFNVTWGDERLGPILSVLKDQNIQKATFFISSVWAQAYPELVKQITASGYEIGSLGHEYKNYISLNEEEIREQIQTAHQIITSLIGREPTLIRFPNGNIDDKVLGIAHDMNYTVIQWHTHAHDWKNPGVDTIVQRITKSVYPGDIVLMHASDSSQQLHEALPSIVQDLVNRGYSFTTVTDLINQSQVYSETVH